MVLSLQLSSIEFRLKMSHISRYWGMSLWVRSFTAPRRLFFLQMKCFGDHWVAVIFYRLRLVLWVLFGALGLHRGLGRSLFQRAQYKSREYSPHARSEILL